MVPHRPPRVPPLLLVLLLAGATLALIAVARAHGLVALSDDDYARIVIAERQSLAPQLDPSGTSWLPLPFWIYGAWLRVTAAFGVAPLAGARLLPWGLGPACAVLIFSATRLSGAAPRQAFAGALLAMSTPELSQHAGLCGPELLAASLIGLSLAARGASLCAPDLRSAVRLGHLAAFASCLASLSRYEAWPVAALVAVLGLRNRLLSWQQRLRELGIALSGCAGWMLHNALVHDDPLHFVARVSAYSRSLGTSFSPSAVLAEYTHTLVFSRAVLVLAAAVAVHRVLGGAQLRKRLFPMLLGLGSVLVFLLGGALRGGVPTHHVERALIPVFLLLAVIACHAGRALYPSLLLQLALLPQGLTKTDGFSRAHEEAVGEALRVRMGRGTRALVSTPDYGYFAVIAASGAPDACTPDQIHDPRTQDGSARFAGPESVPALHAAGIRFVVGHADWAKRASVAAASTLSLYDLNRL
ncbi:MAG: hypothetical protein RL385_5128 [Pseudomonadota bacterium]